MSDMQPLPCVHRTSPLSIPFSKDAPQGRRVRIVPFASFRQDESAQAIVTVAHEMRNFLSPMSLSIDLLRRRVGGDEGAAAALRVLQAQTAGLKRLVGDLLDAARLGQGKFQLRRSRCELRDVAQRAVDMCAAAAADRHQTLRLVTQEPGPVVDVDALRVCQAISNLVLNSVRFTPDDGSITMTVRARGDTALVEVEDTGCGIDPAAIEGLFELYAQQGEGGLGIGLYLVRSIAEMHGGHAAARSDGPGLGSTFTIELPRVPPGPSSS